MPETVNLEGNETAIAMLYPQELGKKYNWEDIKIFPILGIGQRTKQ